MEILNILKPRKEGPINRETRSKNLIADHRLLQR